MIIWKTVAYSTSILFITIAISVLLFRFDGVVFPVATTYHITNLIEKDDHLVIVGTDFNKLRNCNFESMNWYLGPYKNEINKLNRVKVFSQFVTEPAIRTIGEHKIYSEVRLSPEELLTNSHAIAKHDCYNGWLWYTTTIMFVGNFSSIDDAIKTGITITDQHH